MWSHVRSVRCVDRVFRCSPGQATLVDFPGERQSVNYSPFFISIFPRLWRMKSKTCTEFESLPMFRSDPHHSSINSSFIDKNLFNATNDDLVKKSASPPWLTPWWSLWSGFHGDDSSAVVRLPPGRRLEVFLSHWAVNRVSLSKPLHHHHFFLENSVASQFF